MLGIKAGVSICGSSPTHVKSDGQASSTPAISLILLTRHSPRIWSLGRRLRLRQSNGRSTLRVFDVNTPHPSPPRVQANGQQYSLITVKSAQNKKSLYACMHENRINTSRSTAQVYVNPPFRKVSTKRDYLLSFPFHTTLTYITMSLPNMRPVPPTPAMPRFADTSLLMMTEPIFGDATLDDDDWLEPPTPGPSRIAAPRSVIRNKMLDRDAYLPIEEEDEDTQDRIGEDELQIPEEVMFSGRGEKPVERVGGAIQSANSALPRTSSPAISQRKTCRGVHTDPRHYLS